MKLEYILMAVTFAGLFLATAIFQKSKERKGRGGADLARLRDIAAKQLDDSGCYTIAYACCSQVRLSVGRPVTTTYYSYIAAFRPGTLFVIPLQFSGREMVSHPGFRLDRENVGAVRTDRAGRVTFYAADGTELCTLCVSAGNTADGPFQPLNIQQEAEAEKFQSFLRQFTARLQAGASRRDGVPPTPQPQRYPQQETERRRSF